MRYLPILAISLMVCACGDAKPKAHPARPHPSAELVAFQRNGGLAARQGAVPAVLRPAIATLASIADGAGRAGRVTEVRQAPS